MLPLSSSVYETLLPPSSRSVSEWAEAKRNIGSAYSARPGPWDNRYAPYLKMPMDLFGSYYYPRVVMMTSAQVGKSEAGINALLRTIDDEPCAMMLVLPTISNAQLWSRNRLQDAIRSVPSIADVMPTPNSRKNGTATALDMSFPGGTLQLVGANSAGGLSSSPIRVLYLDEIDRYPENVGGKSGEGDPVGLAEARTAGYRDRAIMYTSTPSLKGVSRIESLFESGDMRRWFCTCIVCGNVWVWKFDEHVRFENRDPTTARLLCPDCGTLHDQVAVRKMSSAGQWIATTDSPARTDTASFAIWSIHSPWVTMADIVQKFLDAKRRPEELQVFINTVLGESWEEPGESIDFDVVSQRQDTYTPDTVPAAVVLLTASVDIQKDRLELYVAGWNEEEGHYGITHEVFKGDASRKELWLPLVEMIRKRRYSTQDGRTLRVAGICVDTNYLTDSASAGVLMLRGALPRGGKGVGIVGSSDPSCPIIGKLHGSSAGYRKPRPGGFSMTPTQVRRYWIGASAIKDLIQNRMKLPAKEGGWQWGESFGSRWFKQLSAEHRVIRRVNGKIQRIWDLRPGHRRNEALDLCVYSYAALKFLRPQWVDLRVKKAPEEEKPAPVKRVQQARNFEEPAQKVRSKRQSRLLRPATPRRRREW